MRKPPFLLFVLALSACSSGKVVIDDSGSVGGDDSGTDDSGGSITQGDMSVAPASLDYGVVFVGQAVEKTVTVTNVGEGDVAVALAVSGGAASSYTITPASASPASGESSEHILLFAPGAWGDMGTELVVTEQLGGDEVTLAVTATVQIDQDGDLHGSQETGGDDCDDADSGAYPGGAETWYDGLDSDCLGDDDFDQDADGHTTDAYGGDDCDDTDASVYPGAEDEWYDGIDSDCGGEDDYDADGDGYQDDDTFGEDCNDADASVNPGAAETWYDGVDADCDGADDYDQDADGHSSDAYGGDDCDDTDADVNPDATETWYDGVDADCAGDDDDDQDADGYPVDDDCDDTDPTVTEPVDETLNWADDDCDGETDELSVSDAYSGVLYGGGSSHGLGDAGTFGVMGDLTGDGDVDLVAAADGASYGYAWVVDGASATAAAGAITSYDTAQIAGTSGYYVVNWVNGPGADQDGDGTNDLAIGGWTTSGWYSYGRAWLLPGGSSLSGVLSVSSYDAEFTGDDTDDGMRMIALGDLDGDGYAEVVTGSYADGFSGSSDTGNLAYFSGGALTGALTLDNADGEIHGQTAEDALGYALVIADLNGDGYDDAISGAPGDDDGGDGAGAVYAFMGTASLSWTGQADGAADLKITGSSRDDEVGGDPLPHPGDVDGDGALDLLIANEDEGTAWLFLSAGSLSTPTSVSSADITFSGTRGDYATAAAIDSDLDGDGADEIVLGADSMDMSATDSGGLYVYRYSSSLGSSLGTSDADARIWGGTSQDYLGTGLAGGADLDGDGNEDLLAGAVGQDGGGSGSGAVYVILGW